MLSLIWWSGIESITDSTSQIHDQQSLSSWTLHIMAVIHWKTLSFMVFIEQQMQTRPSELTV